MLRADCKKIFNSVFIIGLSLIFFDSQFLRASDNNTNVIKDDISISKSLPQSSIAENFLIKDLRPSDPAIRDIFYQSGDFSSYYDSLTTIRSTSCFPGDDEKDNFSSSIKYEQTQLDIPVASIEEGKLETDEFPKTSKEKKNFDGRTQVGWPKIQEWPYRSHGHLIMKYDYGTHTGSGVLVGPHHVLTAAHNLYDHNRGWAQEVLFAPARYEGKYPYGECKGCILLVPQKWSAKSKERESYDFGIVILDSAIGQFTGWIGLLSLPDNLMRESLVTITGYPIEKGIGNYYSTQMWEMRGCIKAISDHQLFYDIDTSEGQSGGSIWGKWPEFEGYYTAGVHVCSEIEPGEGNRGIRLTEDKFGLIVELLKSYQLKEDSVTFSAINFSKDLNPSYKSWLRRADVGETEALYQLGILYIKGQSIPKDESKAYDYLCKAAEKGYPPAYTALGLWHEQQRKQHLLKAINLYQQAANNKNVEGMRLLAILFLEEKEFPDKIGKALDLLKEASDNGDGEACYYLACLYDKGLHVTPNKEYAAQLYQKAQKLGYKLSKQSRLFIDSPSNEEIKLQALSKIFYALLHEVSTIEDLTQQASQLTIFMCYDSNNKTHSNEIEKLACDLVKSGIPEHNIYLDKWANRPGSNVTIYQHVDRIFKTARVLVIGSPALKEKYEQGQEGRDINFIQVENLRIRITKQGVGGIIALWLEGKPEENFPEALLSINSKFFSSDYFNEFFSLLEHLYSLSLINNPIKSIKDRFERSKSSLTEEILQGFKLNTQEEQKRLNEKEDAFILKVLSLTKD
jgi:V8-like Glu-specific endopeptidase